MSAILTLSEDFINESFSRYLPEKIQNLKISITDDYLVVTFPVSFIGLKFNPSAAFRFVSFTWTDEKKVFVLELVKTSVLDAAPTLAYIKRFLPEFITIEKDAFLIIDLLRIPDLKSTLENPMLSVFTLEKISHSKGQLSLTVDFLAK